MRPPSHEIRKLTVVLPAYVVEALRPRLLHGESITELLKRLAREEAFRDSEPDPDDFDPMDHPSLSPAQRNL